MPKITTEKLFEKAMNPEMLMEIAAGWEDEPIIASRYGFSEAEYARISAYKPFMAEISRLRAEMERDGTMARAKAKLMAMEVMEECYKVAMTSSAKLSDKLEALKTISKLADMEPKTNAKTQSGPAFSITISLPDSGKAPITIQAQPQLEDMDGDNPK